MKSINNIISQALRQCQPLPDDVEKLTKIAIETRGLVSRYISPKVVEVIFGGSFAKGTWLKEEVDIDIFIKIDKSVNDKEFGQLGEQVGWQSLKGFPPHEYLQVGVPIMVLCNIASQEGFGQRYGVPG